MCYLKKKCIYGCQIAAQAIKTRKCFAFSWDVAAQFGATHQLI